MKKKLGIEMTIVYIHGHGATPNSFNFLRENIKGDSISLEYDSTDGFAGNLARMFDEIKNFDRVFFIGHSLGGLYALHLAFALGERALGGVTMATPYGGSSAALMLSMMFPQQLYRDINPTAAPIIDGIKINLAGLPWTAIITMKGHSKFMATANDGVVTQVSMRARSGAKFVEVQSNHHEVTQSYASLSIIKDAIYYSKLAVA
jgi:pimeloyl-ACP methyl ester carboxylesterase